MFGSRHDREKEGLLAICGRPLCVGLCLVELNFSGVEYRI